MGHANYSCLHCMSTLLRECTLSSHTNLRVPFGVANAASTLGLLLSQVRPPFWTAERQEAAPQRRIRPPPWIGGAQGGIGALAGHPAACSQSDFPAIKALAVARLSQPRLKASECE